jgi:O-antigen/teichoic acid export membrane protein
MKNLIVSGVLWSLLRAWGGRIAGFIVFFQLVRMLSPTEMGMFAAAFAIFVFFEIFVDQGLIHALIQRRTISPGIVNAVFLTNVCSALLLVAALWWLAPPIERWLGSPGLAPVIRAGSLSLIFGALGFCQEALARRDFLFRLLAIRTLASTIVGGVIGVVMAAQGFGIWALVAQLLVSAALNTIALWVRPTWKPSANLSIGELGPLSRFGANVMAMKLVDYGSTRAVELLIAAWLGAAALGLYSVGSKIHYIFLQLIGAALVDVAHSGFARLAHDPARLQRAYRTAVGVTAIISFPFWMMLAVAAPEICVLAFGDRWAGSAALLAPLAVMGALQVQQNYDTAVLNAIGRPHVSLAIGLARTLLALGTLFLMRNAELVPLVQAYVISQFLAAPLSTWLLHLHLGTTMRELWLEVWPPLLGALTGGISVLLFARHPVVGSWPLLSRILAMGLVGMVVYATVLIAVARPRLNHLRAQLSDLRATP